MNAVKFSGLLKMTSLYENRPSNPPANAMDYSVGRKPFSIASARTDW